jgi:glucose-1-phosphate cytidylyltransferase
VKEYFQNYFLHMSDVTLDLTTGQTIIHQKRVDPWKVTLVDTGDGTMTGGRIKRIRDYVGDQHFHMTYGDGVSDIDIAQLMQFHAAHGRDATVTVVHPAGRFGAVDMDGDQVTGFREKPIGQSGFINAGFFILSPNVFTLIEGDATTWEREPMERLAQTGQLMAYRHEGFWRPMDTLRDKQMLEAKWDQGRAPWAKWDKT